MSKGMWAGKGMHLDFEFGFQGLREELLAGLELLIHQLLAHPMVGHCMPQHHHVSRLL